MMITFIQQARLYAGFHQSRHTRFIHIASIVFIYLSFMILLGFVHVLIPDVVETSLADITTFGLLIYYFRMNWRLALVLLPVFVFLLWVASLLSYAGPGSFSLWSLLIIFIIGCALHFIGYLMEGKRPPLIQDLKLLVLAPLFLTAEVFFMAGRMQGLREEIYTTKPD